MLSSLSILAAVLFSIGLYGVLIKRNAVVVLFSLELMLNAVNLNILALSKNGLIGMAIKGQIFILFSIALAAAGAAVGLAVLLALYRRTGNTDIRSFDKLGLHNDHLK